MNKSRIKAVLLLPVNAVIVIPALILLFSQQQVGLAFNLLSFVGLAVWCGGLGLVWRTVALFGRQKKGFIAPWNPPAELIIAGPYRYVRNPMISGVGFMLLGEVMLFINDGLAVWFLLFATVNAVYIPLVEEPQLLATVNAVYIPLVEEPQLLKRFGTAYALYRAEVPRWIPRLHPWSGEALEAKGKK